MLKYLQKHLKYIVAGALFIITPMLIASPASAKTYRYTVTSQCAHYTCASIKFALPTTNTWVSYTVSPAINGTSSGSNSSGYKYFTFTPPYTYGGSSSYTFVFTATDDTTVTYYLTVRYKIVN